MSEQARKAKVRRAILVVEDEKEICELLSDSLTWEGFEPVCVQSDLQAFEALRTAGPFGCMVVDVNLGSGTTGYDVARYARGIAPDLPVVFVSGQTSEESFRANGVIGSLLISKPFTPSELMDRIHTVVGDNDA